MRGAARVPSDGPAAGRLLVRIATLLLVLSMMMVAWTMGAYCALVDSVIASGGMPDAGPMHRAITEWWGNHAAFVFSAAAAVCGLLGALRADARYRALGIVDAVIGGLAAALVVGSNWSMWTPLWLVVR